MNLVRQTFVKRLIAAVIDVICLIIVGTIVATVLKSMPYVAAIAGAVIGLAYMSLDVIKAQTIGKMVMKMKITNVDGTPATQAQLIKRYLIKNSGSLVALVGAITAVAIISKLAALPGLAVLVGFFLTLRPQRQAAHDLLADTAVYGPEAMEFGVPTARQLSPQVAK